MEIERVFIVTHSQNLTWLFSGWPQGEFEIRLYAEAGVDMEGRPALVIDLAKSQVPEFIRLLPFQFKYGGRMGTKLYIREDHIGLTATINDDRYLLFRIESAHNVVFPVVRLIVGPTPQQPDSQLAGEFVYQTVTEW